MSASRLDGLRYPDDCDGSTSVRYCYRDFIERYAFLYGALVVACGT